MGRTRRMAAALIAAGMLFGLAVTPATAQSPGPTATRQPLTFTYGSPNDLDSLNPFVGVEAPAYFTYFLGYDMLVGLSVKDLSPVPDLATSWESTPDGKTWTFHIRRGVRWSDGQPLTANDVVYTYNRILTEEQGNYIDYLNLIDTVEAPDDYTVVAHMKKPTNQLLHALVYILPEHVWKNVTKKQASSFENCCPVVGSGPFQVVEWRKGQFIRLARNPYFWGPKPVLDQVIYRVFDNDDAVIQALKAGEIDYSDTIKAPLYNSLKNDPRIVTHAAEIPSFNEIGINSGADATQPKSDGNPVLKDVQFRRALAMAIDKKTLVDKILLGYGTVGSTVVPPFSAAYHWEPTGADLIRFDPAGANRLLDSLGYKDTNGDGIREDRQGKDIVLRYLVRSENSDTVKTAQFVTQWFKDIGIGTKVQAVSDTKLTDLIYAGDFDIFHWGWFPDPDADFIMSVLSCGQRPPKGTWSDSFYCNPEYDRLYAEQKTALDLTQRADLIKQAQKIAYEDSPYIVLWYDANLQAYRKGWTGFQTQPAGTGDLIAGYGYQAYLTLRPETAGAATASARGIPMGLWAGIAGGVVLIVGGIAVFRRRVGAEDRE